MLETNENKQKEARNSPIFDKQVYKVFVTNSGNEWFLFCLVDFQGFLSHDRLNLFQVFVDAEEIFGRGFES